MEFPTVDHPRDVKVMVDDHNYFSDDQTVS